VFPPKGSILSQIRAGEEAFYSATVGITLGGMNEGMPWRNRLGEKISSVCELEKKKKVSRISKQSTPLSIQGALLTIAEALCFCFFFSLQVFLPSLDSLESRARIFWEAECRRLNC
jgi:hypothetical protein